jgi:hypothetical protein
MASPIEPLLVRLLKGHIDDLDLSAKIARLYTVRGCEPETPRDDDSSLGVADRIISKESASGARVG